MKNKFLLISLVVLCAGIWSSFANRLNYTERHLEAGKSARKAPGFPISLILKHDLYVLIPKFSNPSKITEIHIKFLPSEGYECTLICDIDYNPLTNRVSKVIAYKKMFIRRFYSVEKPVGGSLAIKFHANEEVVLDSNGLSALSNHDWNLNTIGVSFEKIKEGLNKKMRDGYSGRLIILPKMVK